MQLDEIARIVELFDSTKTTKLHLQKGDFCLKLEKHSGIHQITPEFSTEQPAESKPIIQPAPPHTPTASTPSSTQGESITSPMVGTFYRSPSPGAPAYVNVGDKVKKGQTLAIIEAMKIMNEIEAEFDCRILEILPSDGQPVEYSSPLFVVEKL